MNELSTDVPFRLQSSSTDNSTDNGDENTTQPEWEDHKPDL